MAYCSTTSDLPPSDSISTSKQESSPIVVVTGADEGYAPHLAAMLHSLMRNGASDRPLHLHLFDGGFQPDTRERLTNIAQSGASPVEVTWLEPNLDDLCDLPTLPYISTVTYYRLLIPDLLPSSVDRAIYLDADTIIERDLSPLSTLDLGGRAVGAVPDFGVPVVSAQLGISYYEDLGLPPDQPYFNAGMLVMNLPVWRRENIAEQVLHHLRTYREELTLSDQEALNAVLADDWHPLDVQWNSTTEAHAFWRRHDADDPFPVEGATPSRRPRTAPSILHFTSARKPWHPNCRHPLQDRYLHYLQSSGWYSPTEWTCWYGALLVRKAWWALRYYTRPLREWIHPRLVRRPERRR